MVTRRCAQGQFLLRPSALVNQVFLYCMACAVECSSVQVVAFVALSNHWHAIVMGPIKTKGSSFTVACPPSPLRLLTWNYIVTR